MYKLTKLAADGTDLPPEATGHLAVRLERDILAQPIIVANAMPSKGLTQPQAKKWADALTIYGRSWRLAQFEEAILVPDRSRTDVAIDPNFFTDIDPGNWFWTGTPYARAPGYFWGVNLGYGNSFADHQDNHSLALAVCAGQF